VLIGGSPGTGKSTTAEALADRTGFMVLSSDALRKELAGVPPATHRFAPLDSGIYDRESTTQVYATLLHRAGQLLGLGESVILDASWASEESRRLAREAARDAGAEMIEIRCVLDPVEAATRVARRLRQESTTSDATPALAHELAGRFDPWHEAAEVDTRIARTTVASAAEKVIDRRWTSPA
jgi:predicted kinase